MGLSRVIRLGLIAVLMLAAVPASAEQICSAAWESVTNPDHGTVRLSCPNGETIQSIDFASYGTPNPEPYYYDPDNFDVTSHLNPTLAPACEDLAAISLGSCDSNLSVDVLEAYCLGESSCEVEATNDLFGDPCFGTYKRLYVIATCSDNRPPVCDTAQATPDILWPPDHKLVPIGISGVTDPDGDVVSITVDGIRQDEPVLQAGTGSGTTCPDATGVGTDTPKLRAERAGNKEAPGDGRVYHITFTAEDGMGGACAGEVTVCVPHDQGQGNACVDQGPLYDSTVCP